MRVSPKIRDTLKEISTQAIVHANTPSPDYKHLRRLLRVYDKHLSEEERIFLLKTMLEFVHYRSVMVDPDNLLVLSNIKLRTYVFIFVLVTFGMLIAAALFKTNSALNGLLEVAGRFIKLFSL